MKGAEQNNRYVVKGFLFMTKRRHFTDPAMYGDWVGISFPVTVMREELHMGRLPEGLLLSSSRGLEVVKGPTGMHDQKLVPLSFVLDQGNYGLENQANPKQKKAAMIAEKLGELRSALGMTQQELALRIGLSPMTVKRLESGYKGFRLSTAEKLLNLEPLYEEVVHCE